MAKSTKNTNFDWNKEMIDEGFQQEVGKCLVITMDIDEEDSDGMAMQVKICRIGKDSLEANAMIGFGDDKTEMRGTYKRNVPMDEANDDGEDADG